MIMLTGRGAKRLEESTHHFYIQEAKDGWDRVLKDSQPHLNPWKVDGAAANAEDHL